MSLLNQKSSMTLLAGALLFGLSACANRPIVDPDSRLGKAGDKFGEVSSAFWVKTKHVFRLDGTDAYAVPPKVAKNSNVEMPAEYKDELDLALVEDGFQSGPGINDEITLSAVDTNSAIKVGEDMPAALEIIELEPAAEELATEELIIDEVAVATESAEPAAEPIVIVRADLDYEVQPNENLWDISKRLTGDATNWRDLAALNSLDSNGTVYGGQKLQIPGDMLKPDVAEPTMTAAAPVVANDGMADPATARLQVPTATAVDAVSDIVVAKAEAPAIPAGPTTSFKVQAGESMWDLAKRTTGDATNWKTIAAANGLSEADAALIKYGQSLNVPDNLLEYGGSATEVASTPAPTAAPTAAPTDESVIQSATAASDAEVTQLAASTSESATGAVESDEELTIMPAKFQSEPPVIKVDEPAVAAASAEDPIDWIMVSGTYYPKAIYNDANFSATLLTRVSPGTKLQVSRAIGPWYEVKTDRGLGYVHSRDIK